MNDVKLERITDDIQVIFNHNKTKLPQEIQVKIDSYWDLLNSNKQRFRRGEVYNIVKLLLLEAL